MTAGLPVNLALLVLYVLMSVSGLHVMKAAGGALFTWWFVGGFGLYGLGFLIWYALLTRMPLSIAFPLAAGALILATQISGWLVLGEAPVARQLLGMVLILVGLAVIFPRGA